MNKKILIGLIAVGIVVVVVVVGFFLLGGLKPPVDISGVNLPTTMTMEEMEELLPTELNGIQLSEGSVETGSNQMTTSTRSFYVNFTSAEYDGIDIVIVKADSKSDATDTLDYIYSSARESGSGTYTKTNDWFQCDVDGVHGFYWRSGEWVFGVRAGDSDTMKQAAEDLVEHLRSKS